MLQSLNFRRRATCSIKRQFRFIFDEKLKKQKVKQLPISRTVSLGLQAIFCQPNSAEYNEPVCHLRVMCDRASERRHCAASILLALSVDFLQNALLELSNVNQKTLNTKTPKNLPLFYPLLSNTFADIKRSQQLTPKQGHTVLVSQRQVTGGVYRDHLTQQREDKLI